MHRLPSFAILFFSCVSIVFALDAWAQQPLIDMPVKLPIQNIEAIAVGDSVLLSLSSSMDAKRRTFWVSDGKAVEWALPNGPFATVSEDDGLYLYYLEKQKKSAILKAYILDDSKSLRISNMQALLRGEIIGLYKNEGLHLVLLDRESFSLTFVSIDKTTISDSKSYNIPADVRWGEDAVDFYAPNDHMNSFKGFADVKMFPLKDVLHITIDRKKSSSSKINTGSSQQGTIVLTINLKTSEVSKSFFPQRRYTSFTSFLMDGKLFRAVPTPSAFMVDVFDMTSNQSVHQDSIKPFLNFKCYFRYGRKSIIGHKAPIMSVMKESAESLPVISVDRIENDYQIQYGTYYSKAGGVEYNDKAIAGLVGESILQYQERPGVHRYFDYVVDGSKGYVKTDKAFTTLRERLDDYEVDGVPRVDYKTYFNYKDGLAGLYVNEELGRLFITYYKGAKQKNLATTDSDGF